MCSIFIFPYFSCEAKPFFSIFSQSYAYRCTLRLLSKLAEYHCDALNLVLINSFADKKVGSVKNIYANAHCSVLNLNPSNTIECQNPGLL